MPGAAPKRCSTAVYRKSPGPDWTASRDSSESRTGFGANRWTESAVPVNAFGVWLDEQRSRVSRLGEKLIYIASQWDGLLACRPCRTIPPSPKRPVACQFAWQPEWHGIRPAVKCVSLIVPWPAPAGPAMVRPHGRRPRCRFLCNPRCVSGAGCRGDDLPFRSRRFGTRDPFRGRRQPRRGANLPPPVSRWLTWRPIATFQ